MRITRRAVPALLAAPALAQDRPIRIGGGLSSEAPQYAVALDRGLFREAGLTPAVTNFPTGREAFEALVGGQLDVALMAEFPAVVGALRAQRFGVLAVLTRYTASRIIVKRRPGSEPRMAALAGRKIGVTVGTNTHFMLVGELAAAGVTVEVVNVGPADLIPTLVRGDIDAAVTFPSFYAGARRALGADYQEIRTTGYEPTYLVAGSEAFIREGEGARRFLSALIRAEAMMEADAPAAQAATARVAGRSQTAEAIRDSWPDYRHKVTLDDALVSLMQRQGAWLVERGAVRGEAGAAVMRAAVADGPLRGLAADRVNLG